MVVFYNELDGEILASFPEAYELPSWLTVSREGVPSKHIKTHVIKAEYAKDFEDPRNPKNIHNYRVKLDKKGKPDLVSK